MSVLHCLAFDMIRTERGWVPHLSIAIDGKRYCLKGPALAVYADRQWRQRLVDQAKRLQDGARNDLVFLREDAGTTYYACPATL